MFQQLVHEDPNVVTMFNTCEMYGLLNVNQNTLDFMWS